MRALVGVVLVVVAAVLASLALTPTPARAGGPRIEFIGKLGDASAAYLVHPYADQLGGYGCVVVLSPAGTAVGCP